MKVAVVGCGQTVFGEHWDKSLRDLATESLVSALKEGKINLKDIEALFVGNMSGGRFVGQEHVGALVADYANLAPIPSVRCEGACASGALAFRQAYHAIKSGDYDIVAVTGVEKMTDLKIEDVTTTLMGAGDQEWEGSIGLTFPGLYALMARAHMHKYGTTREQMAMVSVINHKNGLNNPYAQYKKSITVEDVLKSPLVADPLRLLDCSPITDGAATVILASERVARKFENPIWVMACTQASDTLALHDRKSLTELAAVKNAVKKAYETTGTGAGKMDVAEVHDCFSINEILTIEGLGFCKDGAGGPFVEQGKITLAGEIPVNTTGGLKSIGHPVGATGVRQIIDITRQLGGMSVNQIRGAKRGIALNVGGSGATAVVTILGGSEYGP